MEIMLAKEEDTPGNWIPTFPDVHPLCTCGQLAKFQRSTVEILKKGEKNPNFYRPYWTCPRSSNKCKKSFVWVNMVEISNASISDESSNNDGNTLDESNDTTIEDDSSDSITLVIEQSSESTENNYSNDNDDIDQLQEILECKEDEIVKLKQEAEKLRKQNNLLIKRYQKLKQDNDHELIKIEDHSNKQIHYSIFNGVIKEDMEPKKAVNEDASKQHFDEAKGNFKLLDITEMNIGSWNIYYGEKNEQFVDNVIAFMKEQDIPIMSLQECCTGTVKAFKKLNNIRGEYIFYCHTGLVNNNSKSQQNCIIVKRGFFDDDKILGLSDINQENLFKFTSYPPMVLWGDVKGHSFMIASVHTPGSQKSETIYREISKYLKLDDKRSDFAIVIGDYNWQKLNPSDTSNLNMQFENNKWTTCIPKTFTTCRSKADGALVKYNHNNVILSEISTKVLLMAEGIRSPLNALYGGKSDHQPIQLRVGFADARPTRIPSERNNNVNNHDIDSDNQSEIPPLESGSDNED